MTIKDKLALAKTMNDFWHKPENEIYIFGNIYNHSPKAMRKWFCEMTKVYMDHLRRKMKKGNE